MTNQGGDEKEGKIWTQVTVPKTFAIRFLLKNQKGQKGWERSKFGADDSVTPQREERSRSFAKQTK